jgi:hypothetical protein
MASNVEPRLQRRLAAAVANLLPAYFALVMATGIMAIAMRLLGIPVLDWCLLLVSGVGYAILGGLTLLRLLCYVPNVLADLTGAWSFRWGCTQFVPSDSPRHWSCPFFSHWRALVSLLRWLPGSQYLWDSFAPSSSSTHACQRLPTLADS